MSMVTSLVHKQWPVGSRTQGHLCAITGGAAIDVHPFRLGGGGRYVTVVVRSNYHSPNTKVL